MRKGGIRLILFVSTLLVLTNCKKFGETYDVYFYTDIENPTGPLTLSLDGKTYGELPLIKAIQHTGNDTILNNAIHLRLRTGKYDILVRDNRGNIKCSGDLKFRFNNFNGATNEGALVYAMSNKSMI